jgi:hypothetical protein
VGYTVQALVGKLSEDLWVGVIPWRSARFLIEERLCETLNGGLARRNGSISEFEDLPPCGRTLKDLVEQVTRKTVCAAFGSQKPVGGERVVIAGRAIRAEGRVYRLVVVGDAVDVYTQRLELAHIKLRIETVALLQKVE